MNETGDCTPVDMTSTLKDCFERSCRLCAQEQEVTLMIFSAEAEAMLLQNKLNKYLLIEVDEDDKLPKNICIECCSKLQTVCDFIDTVHKSQEVLLKQSIELDELQSMIDEYPTPNIKISDIKSLPKDIHDETKITSMEISVDPMDVLQNSDLMLSSPNIDDTCQIKSDDVSHLHGLHGENVTIKLIKKGENLGPKDYEENTKSYDCTIYNHSFSPKVTQDTNFQTHNSEDVDKTHYTCGVCSEKFVYKNILIQHMRLHNTDVICKVCGRVTMKNLSSHMAVHTPKNKSFTCKICGRSYSSLSNLRVHSITHSTDRPYQCNFCTKTYKRNQDLKFHINQHTGAKPYQCPFCDKAFASSGNCYSHRTRMHPGYSMQRKKQGNKTFNKKSGNGVSGPSKPIKYQCHICARTFIKSDNYSYHMYQHTGVKPYSCSFCPEKYVTRKGLLSHHTLKHPTKNRPLALLSKNILLI